MRHSDKVLEAIETFPGESQDRGTQRKERLVADSRNVDFSLSHDQTAWSTDVPVRVLSFDFPTNKIADDKSKCEPALE